MIEIAKQYKRLTASKYAPVAEDEMLSKIMEAEKYYVSPKYDGHLYILHFDGSKLELINHSGNVIDDLPMFSDAKKLLSDFNEIILAGELYLFDEGKRTRSFELKSSVNKKSKDIYFAAFDIISINGEESNFDDESLIEKLKSILHNGQSIHPIECLQLDSRSKIEDYYKQIVEERSMEGIVVRSHNGPVYKVKPKITIDAVILGYVQSQGERSEMIKELLVGLCVSENKYIVLSKIYNGFDDNKRASFLKDLESRKVDSNYIEVSGSNLAFIMVKPEIVIEFSCLDIYNESTKGPISKMSLTFKDNAYYSEGKSSSASVTSPTFLRIRDDKKPDVNDVGISQVTRIISLDTASSEKISLKKSELLKKEIYVKNSKGINMVRKFVIWKTNKDHTGEYPAYIYHFTDFSPSRADVLKKDLKVSNSKKQIEEIFNDEILKNIKKGWEKV
tara:strand:- start:1071 stop:2411 length:1341 start_codon:yes stop_codon:yes gene_type:complete